MAVVALAAASFCLYRSLRVRHSNNTVIPYGEIPLNNYPEQHRSVLRRIVKQYLFVLLDRRLNMHAYLEELGR